MINAKKHIDHLLRVDFGEIDGYGDPKLTRYFLDNDYWNKIVCDKTFYVVGKKGTGKSSIYRMIAELGMQRGVMVENKDFGDFPFEKLLNLSDDSFAMPNQYQSVWKNLILSIFACMIAKRDVSQNPYHEELSRYVEQCLGDIIELHKEIVNYTTKINGSLAFGGIHASRESEKSMNIGFANGNVTQINSRLFELIVNYLINCDDNEQYIIQFDRLDDNYNQYQNLEQYYQAIISLFKVVYQVNQSFRQKNISGAKIVLYIRSDIYRELGSKDAESARWDDYKMSINWAIINRDDWKNSPLLQMINKRITTSIDDSVSFDMIFDNRDIDLKKRGMPIQSIFQYMVDRTLHRPRDLVQFCKYIQAETRESGRLYFRTILNAEKKYSYWLVSSELANEINPILKRVEPVFDMLKLLGSRPFSLSDFYDRYKAVKGIGMDVEKLVYYLYDVGIIQNIDTSKSYTRIRSIVRNEGKLDRNQRMIIHIGVWKGLNA